MECLGVWRLLDKTTVIQSMMMQLAFHCVPLVNWCKTVRHFFCKRGYFPLSSLETKGSYFSFAEWPCRRLETGDVVIELCNYGTSRMKGHWWINNVCIFPILLSVTQGCVKILGDLAVWERRCVAFSWVEMGPRGATLTTMKRIIPW